MKISKIKQFLLVIAAIIAACWAPAAQAATPISWNETGFSINANGMTLRQVLNEFGEVYGVRISLGVDGGAVLKTRLQSSTGSEFLDRLGFAHKFRWFVYNNMLYVVGLDDNISMRIEVGEDSVQDAKAALTGLGLYDARFGWGEIADEGVVLVSGPRQYVELARSILLPEGKKDKNANTKGIMVFRLKYANAADRVVTTRGQKTTVPGIKTILAGLLNPPSAPKSTSNADRFDPDSTKRSHEKHLGSGGAREVGPGSQIAEAQREDDDDRRRKNKDKQREDAPRIDADPSLNAIIIYDTLGKREMYQSLIAELDVEPQQVEIEALIVDIDRNKLSEMGVEWSVGIGNATFSMNSTGNDSAGTDLPLPGSTLLIRNASRFYARLKALEGTGEARVLAKPTVLTLENVAAVLDLSQTAYLSLVGERVADVANITAGTMLKVLPRIVREGGSTRVRLDVDIEDGTLGKTDGNTSANRSTITTQAIIDAQQTLMIGGYHAETKTTGANKVPVLGDLPLLGGLFRTATESTRDRERLFLITPRLAGTSGTPAPARSAPAERADTLLSMEGKNDSASGLRLSLALSCGEGCGR